MKVKRNGTIDLFKFAFTIMVMLYHTTKWFKGGYIAVDFFFIVSGFLMAKSMQKTIGNNVPIGTDTVKFVFKKAKGIFPFYISAWIISFFATMLINGIKINEFFNTLFRSFYNIFMTEMFGNFDMGHRVQASWYISAMLIGIFILYPIRKKITNSFDRIIAPLIFFVFVGMAYQSGSGVSSFTVGYNKDLLVYNGLIRGVAELSLGCICYNFCERIKKYEYTKTGSALLSAAEWLGFGLVFYYASTSSASDMDLALLPILAISITIAFSDKSLFDKLFTNRIFTILGTFSLQIYLTHEFVKNTIIPYLRNTYGFNIDINVDKFKYLVVYVLLTLIASLICYCIGKLLIKVTNVVVPKIKSKLIVK